MWGSATLTMVVSSTTMSWEVRMTKRNTEGLLKRPRGVPGLALLGTAGRGRARPYKLRWWTLASDLSAGIV